MNLRTEEDFLLAIQRLDDCAARIDSLLDQFLPNNARELLEELKGKANIYSLRTFTRYGLGKDPVGDASDLLPVEYLVVEDKLRRCSLKDFLDEVFLLLPGTQLNQEYRSKLVAVSIPGAVEIFDQLMDIYLSFASEAFSVSGVVASVDYIKGIYERCYTIIGFPITIFTDDQLEGFSREYIDCAKAARDFKDEWLSYEKPFFERRKERFDWGGVYEALLLKQVVGEDDFSDNDDILLSEGYGFVYFVRNGDLFKVGITENLLRRMGELAPDEILNCVRCSNFRELEREIHSAFKEVRLPQTEYFRLGESQVQQVHRMIAERSVM